jgi:copper resistance protein B
MKIIKTKFSQAFRNNCLFAVVWLTAFFPGFGLANEKIIPEAHKHHHGMAVSRQKINTAQESSIIHNGIKQASHHAISMKETSMPSTTRDPHAYSDGYGFGPLERPKMGDEDYLGSAIVDRLESVTARGDTSMTYDWQAWYGNSYDKTLVKAEGEIEAGTFKNARNELLWAYAVTPFWDTQLGIRYDSGKGTDRGWLAFGVQGLMPYWVYTEATAYVNEHGRTSFRLELEYDWLLTQKLILQPRVEMNFYSQRDDSRDISSGLSNVEAGMRLRYEIRREFAPYAGIEWASGFDPSIQNIRRGSNNFEEIRFVAGVHFWL